MKRRLETFVEEILKGVRNVIVAGEPWSPTLFLVRGNQATGMVLPTLGSGAAQKEIISGFINDSVEESGADWAILVADAWIASAKTLETVRQSLRDHPQRGQALTVCAWRPKETAKIGLQVYSRASTGQVTFQPFAWEDSSAYSRFGMQPSHPGTES